MYRSHVLVCGGTGCTSSHSAEIIAEFEKEIAEKAAQLRADYLERARRRIQLNSDTERAAAEKAWAAREAEYARQTERLETIYREHRDEWVDAIVHSVLDA